eukprot:gene31158-61015_t
MLRDITKLARRGGLTLLLFGLLFGDWKRGAELRERIWFFSIVLLDLALLFANDSKLLGRLVISVVTPWIILVAVESHLRFGLFDSEFVQIEHSTLEVCDCAHPPCSRKLSTAYMWLSPVFGCMALILDWHLKLGIATNLRGRETELADYDTMAAEKVLTAASRSGAPLPPRLHTILERLIANLHAYQPVVSVAFSRAINEDAADLEWVDTSSVRQMEQRIGEVNTEVCRWLTRVFGAVTAGMGSILRFDAVQCVAFFSAKVSV